MNPTSVYTDFPSLPTHVPGHKSENTFYFSKSLIVLYHKLIIISKSICTLVFLILRLIMRLRKQHYSLDSVILK